MISLELRPPTPDDAEAIALVVARAYDSAGAFRVDGVRTSWSRVLTARTPASASFTMC